MKDITTGNITQLMTVGGTGTFIDNTYYPWGVPQTSPTFDWTKSYTVYHWPSEPIYCSGNVHVFGCDHAEKCKCGKSKRKVEPPVCPHCMKAHG